MIFKNKLLLSFAATILYCLLILPVNEKIAFEEPSAHINLLISYGLKALFAVVLFFLIYFVLNFTSNLRSGNKIYKSWLKFSAIYFCIIFTIFLLVYPGHWVADEFRIVTAVQHYGLEYNWQNYFTNIFYTFCMYIIPTAVSIIFIQILFASFVIGYVTSQFQRLLSNKKLAYLLLIPFLFFPVIVNDLYPLRGMMYAFIELLLISKLLFLFYKLDKRPSPTKELIAFSVLIMLLSFWRTEGIYYLCLLPILGIYFKVFTRNTYKSVKPYLLVISCLLIIGGGFAITKATSDSKYTITAMLNPLSTMVQEPLKGNNIDARLAIMNQTVDMSVVKQYPSYNETPAFWNGGIRENYDKHLKSFVKQYVYLVVHNPKPFFENRFKTFVSTNSFDSLPSASLGTFDKHYLQNPVALYFMKTNFAAHPINISLKTKVTSLLTCINSKGKFTLWAHLIWNAMIPIALLLVLGIIKVIKRQWLWAGIIALVLLRVIIIFLTAPANYFFYYLPVYVVGYFLVFLAIVQYIDTRLAKRQRRI